VKKAGKDGITESDITDRCRSIDRKRREEILADLVLAGRVELREIPTKSRPMRRYFIR
jgi:homoserine dehydrogenase